MSNINGGFMKETNDKYLSVKEVNKITKINSSTLYTLLNYDRIDSEIIAGRRVIRESKLKQWMQNNLQELNRKC